MNTYKKLFNNTLVFAMGSLGSKLISFLLVPLYTYYLTKSEFGMVDLIITTTSLLVPIFTLSIFEAVLRFAMDENYDKQTILVNSLFVTLLGFISLLFIYPILMNVFPFENYLNFLYILLFTQSINASLSQYIRASGYVKLFAINGIFNAFILLITSIVFLIVFDMGIIGYVVSPIIANTLSSIFLIVNGKIQQDFNFKKINLRLMTEMMRYSIPLIPNSLMWWIMVFSDRYIITYFLGLSANGLYAVANKIPSILSIINSIFFQAWQMSAIEEKDSEDKSEFFSNVFNLFSVVLLISSSLILLHLKIIIDILVSDIYFDVWKYVPFLLLGVIFSSFSAFLGTNYIATKKTSGVLKTTILGAIINISINIILIPLIGINGATIGTMISFFIVWIIRIKDTKEFVNIRLNTGKLLLTFMILLIQIMLMYMNLSIEYLIQLGLLILIIFINFNETKIIFKKILGFVLNKYSHLF
ncbi:lipopolysaccharide biosynthesis protein [Sporosarcina sp. BP05]|uniref:lipopolysaccharide biosynthesis protein n=1 Tax=Sporosarcina sp. BP05 TaxID=2758726 RepID=UPI001648B7F4|nr:oligosaccharide flippase family protein [Sporosarcina sp. BP05]